MGAVIIIVALLILFLYFVSKNKAEVNSVPKEKESTTATTPKMPYVSFEHSEICDKYFFDSSVICGTIRDKIGMDSITIYGSDNKKNKSLIKEGETISIIHFNWIEYYGTPSTKRTAIKQTRASTVFSKSDGYIKYSPVPMFGAGKSFLVCSIYKDFNTLLNQEYGFDGSILYDKFDQKDKILWSKINGDEYAKSLSLSSSIIKLHFNLLNDKPVLLLRYSFKLSKGSSVTFLFNDNTMMSFPLSGIITDEGFRNIPLSTEDITRFCEKKILKIRIGKDEMIKDYSLTDEEQEAITRFTDAFVKLLEPKIEDAENKEWLERVEKEYAIEEAQQKKSCWVYLMHDTVNDTYKIGISNNPEYRERTLQSEKPSIEKIAAKQFPSRDIARAIETSLHKVYETRRLRGEWFKLQTNEVEDVKKTLL